MHLWGVRNMANEVELIVDGSGALRTLGAVEKGAEKAGAAVDGLNASGAKTGSSFSTGAVDRFTAAMVKMEDATRRGAAVTTESVARRSAEQRALERWQSRESEQMALQIRLRREAERAAVDMANAVRLGYTSQEQALQSLMTLEARHAVQLQAVADGTQNVAVNAQRTVAANNNLASSFTRVAASANAARGNTANVAAQFQDVAVTAAMGMNPMMIALQQGTQLSAVLNSMQNPIRGLASAFVSLINPVSLLTIGFVAAGAAAVQYFMNMKDDTRSTDDILSDHAKAIRSLKDAYGEAAKGAREYLAVTKEMATADVVISVDQSTARLDELVKAFVDSGKFLRTETEQIEEELKRVNDAMMRLNAQEAQAAKGWALKDRLDELYEQLENAGTGALVATSKFAPFREELEAFADSVKAGTPDVLALQQAISERIADPAATLSVRNLGAELKAAIEEMFRLQSGAQAGKESLKKVEDSAALTEAEIRELSDAIADLGKIGVTSMSDAARAAEAYQRSVSAVGATLETELAAALEFDAAMKRIRGNMGADLNRRIREVEIGGMSDRDAAAARIRDDWTPFIDGLREAGVASSELDRATAAMNEALRQSGAHFDEIERKAGEKGAAKAVKALDTEMARFVSTADRLVDDWFPGEAARREAEELLALLARFPNALDDVQRAAVQLRVDSLFQAAALGVRELDKDGKDATSELRDGLLQLGPIAAGIFEGAKESVWDWVDAIAAAIGQAGQLLMSLGEQSKEAMKVDPVASLAATTAQAARAIPANYSGAAPAASPVAAAANAATEAARATSSVAASVSNLSRFLVSGKAQSHVNFDSDFGARLDRFLSDAPGGAISIFSGFRSIEHQTKLWTAALEKYGSAAAARKWVAPPGNSQHNFGRAADLRYANDNARSWAHQNAGAYGLTFRMGHEPWHIEPAAGAAPAGIAASSAMALPQTAPVPTPAQQPQLEINAAPAGAPAGTGSSSNRFLTGLGAAASGFASGYNTQNPLMGAISGGLGALGTGDPLAIGLGILGGLIGGIVGLIKQIQEAREELKRLGPEIRDFISVGMGGGVSALGESVRSFNDQANEYIEIARKARDWDLIAEIEGAQREFAGNLAADFRAGFEGQLAALSGGMGFGGEFVEAQQAILNLREEIKGFVADAEWTYGARSSQVGRARAAGREGLLSMLDRPESISETEAELNRMAGTASVLREALMQLGMSGDAAAQAIRDRLIRSVEDMQKAFRDDLSRSVVDLAGRGHLVEIVDAQQRYNERLETAARLGTDASLAQDELVLSLANIANGAGLSREELAGFASQIGISTQIVERAGEAILQTARYTEQQASSFADLSLRLLELAVNTDTLEGQLAVFDRRRVIEIARMRQAEATAEELALAEQALGYERQAIIDTFNRRLIDDAKSTFDTVLAHWKSFVSGIGEFRTGLSLNPSLSALSPSAQLSTARGDFADAFRGALAGNRADMDRLQGTASAYLEQAAGFWSSSEQYAAIFNEVQAKLAEVETRAATEVTIAEQQLAAMQPLAPGLASTNDSLVTLTQATADLRAAVDTYLGDGGTFSGVAAGAMDAANAAVEIADRAMASVLEVANDNNDILARIAAAAEQELIASAFSANAAAELATQAARIGDGAEAIVDALLAQADAISTGSGNWSDFFTAGSPNQRAAGNYFASEQQRIDSQRQPTFFDRVGDWFADILGFADGTANTGGMPGEIRGFVHGQEAVIPLPSGGRVPVQLSGGDNGELVSAVRDLLAATRANGRIAREGNRSADQRGAATNTELAALRQENERLRKKLETMVRAA